LWQHVAGQTPVLAARATTDVNGLVSFVRRPGANVWYTIDFPATTEYSASSTQTRIVSVLK